MSMLYTQVGRVSSKAGARVHLDLHGLAACGAGSGRILSGTSRDVQASDRCHLCRRCGKLLAERLRYDYSILVRRPSFRRLADAIDGMIDDLDPVLPDPAMVESITRFLSDVGGPVYTDTTS